MRIVKITIAGNTYGGDYLGIKDHHRIKIIQNKRGEARVGIAGDGHNWQVVDTPHNYGNPAISIAIKIVSLKQ